ncbi:MAG TPA: hypothetical protein VFI70_00700 [Nitrososphaeraceae archaeon]|nr:hypothetical protein [Nitrososphaeraceae archaeon]
MLHIFFPELSHFDNDKESNEPNYDEDKDQLEEREEETGKITVNQVFCISSMLSMNVIESREELDRWLKRIQKNITDVLYGAKPLILWSGHGYHIIIPVKATEALEQFEDFKTYTNESSKEFLQFAERFLSLNKSDPANKASFKLKKR